MKYADLLKDPRWKKRRLDILERDGNRCQMCGEKNQLHIHHRTYLNRVPWDYPDEYLVTLCEDCHDSEGELRPRVEKQILDDLRLKFFYRDLNAFRETIKKIEPVVWVKRPEEDDY